jgi:PilZ domain
MEPLQIANANRFVFDGSGERLPGHGLHTEGSDSTWFIWGLPLASAARKIIEAEAYGRKRKHPRTDINEPAYVSSGGSVMSCMVRNISLEGAAIDVENPAFVPPRFRLVMANGAAVREARIVWIQQNRIGLSFDDQG